MIDQGGGRHTYQAIAWEIRGLIERGDLGAGDRIPSLPEITRDKGVSYPTAQAAVRLLKTWRLVRSEPGRATFVLEVRPVINMMTEMTLPGQDGRRRTWREICAEYGMEGTQRVTGAGRTTAPIDVADAFEVESDTIMAWRQRLLLVDGHVAQISTSYYPESVVKAVPALLAPERLPTNAMELMAQAGFEIVPGGRDLVFARAATEDEASTLSVELGAPVTEVLRTARNAQGDVVTVERMVSDSSRLRQVWVF